MQTMNFKRISTLVVAGVAILATQAAQPARAIVFDFTSNPAGNATTFTYQSTPPGINLDVFTPSTFGTPLPTTFNSTPVGLCAWAVVGSSGGRCGYNLDPSQGINGFKIKFDQAVTIYSFLLASDPGVQNIDSATVGFSLDNVTFNSSPIFSDSDKGTLISLLTPFNAPANTDIFVKTTATLKIGFDSGVIRLATLQVPGPLPVLGAAAALGWSRKLRKRIAAQKFN